MEILLKQQQKERNEILEKYKENVKKNGDGRDA